MERGLHLLKVVGGDTMPSLFASISCKLEKSPTHDPQYGSLLQVKQACIYFQRFDRDQRADSNSLVSTGDGILAELARRCRKNKSIWLFGSGIYRQLVALRFFDRFAKGEWTLGELADDMKNGAGPPRSKYRRGFVVFEPGVTILCCYRKGGGSLNVVDIGNYNLPHENLGPEGSLTAAFRVMERACQWREFVAAHKLGTFRHTLGSQAFYAFRKRFMAEPIICHNHAPALQLESNAYHGGRCEMFRHGKIKGPIHHLDFNSLYGWVASVLPVPTVIQGYADSDDAFRTGPESGVIADLLIKTDKPCVPCWHPTEKTTIYPTGTFRVQLCQPEIHLVLDNVVEIYSAAWYSMSPALAEFANWSWARRKEIIRDGHDHLINPIKLWSQVLYGKFGQRQRGWQACPGEPTTADWASWYRLNRESGSVDHYRAIAGHVERHVDSGFAPNSCPQIAAWITSAARVRLWQAMTAAGLGNVFYVDTDSLWVNGAGFVKLKAAGFVNQDSLGGLRLVATHNEVEFRGIKHYVADGVLTCSGLKKDDKPGGGTEPIYSACRAGRAPVPLDIPIAAKRSEVYRHGLLRSDGSVVPWHFSERGEK